jgi:hypothetical protein
MWGVATAEKRSCGVSGLAVPDAKNLSGRRALDLETWYPVTKAKFHR